MASLCGNFKPPRRLIQCLPRCCYLRPLQHSWVDFHLFPDPLDSPFLLIMHPRFEIKSFSTFDRAVIHKYKTAWGGAGWGEGSKVFNIGLKCLCFFTKKKGTPLLGSLVTSNSDYVVVVSLLLHLWIFQKGELCELYGFNIPKGWTLRTLWLALATLSSVLI